MVRSSHELIFESNLSDDQSSDVNIVDSLDYPIEKQVNDPNEFDFDCRIFYSHDAESVPIDSITSINFSFTLEVDLIDCKSSGLGTIDSSSVSSSLIIPLVEDSEVANVSTKVTCIRSLVLNMILVLLFL